MTIFVLFALRCVCVWEGGGGGGGGCLPSDKSILLYRIFTKWWLINCLLFCRFREVWVVRVVVRKRSPLTHHDLPDLRQLAWRAHPDRPRCRHRSSWRETCQRERRSSSSEVTSGTVLVLHRWRTAETGSSGCLVSRYTRQNDMSVYIHSKS